MSRNMPMQNNLKQLANMLAQAVAKFERWDIYDNLNEAGTGPKKHGTCLVINHPEGGNYMQVVFNEDGWLVDAAVFNEDGHSGREDS